MSKNKPYISVYRDGMSTIYPIVSPNPNPPKKEGNYIELMSY